MSDTACPLCGPLGDGARANTGRDDRLPAASSSLEKLTDTLRRCPFCGAFFEWEDLPQMYGSGNNAEERLDRLLPDAAAALLRLREGRADDPKGMEEEAFRRLPQEIVLWALRPHLDWCPTDAVGTVRFEHLLSPVIDRLVAAAREPGGGLGLSNYCSALLETRWEPVARLLRAREAKGHVAALLQECEALRRSAPLAPAEVIPGALPVPALVLAAARGEWREVKAHLDAGANLLIRDPLGWSPLHAAAANGHTQVVQLLLAAGAPSNYGLQAIDGATPLQLAALAGSRAVLRLLLAAGHVPGDPFGSTALNHTTPRSKAAWTAFTFAAAGAHAAAMEVLAAAGNGGEQRDAAHYFYASLLARGHRVTFSKSAFFRENEHDERGPGEFFNEVWSVDRPMTLSESELLPIDRFRGSWDQESYHLAGAIRSSVLPYFTFEVGAEPAPSSRWSDGHFDDWQDLLGLTTPRLAGLLHGTAPLGVEARQALLATCARVGATGWVRWLLRDTPRTEKAFEAAATAGMEVVVALAEGRGPAPGQLALRIAADPGRLGTLRALLEAGGDPWAQSEHGTTALDTALALKNEVAASLLRAWMAQPKQPGADRSE